MALRMLHDCLEALRLFQELIPEFRRPDTCMQMGYLLDTVRSHLEELRALGSEGVAVQLVAIELALRSAEKRLDELIRELADDVARELVGSVRFSSVKT